MKTNMIKKGLKNQILKSQITLLKLVYLTFISLVEIFRAFNITVFNCNILAILYQDFLIVKYVIASDHWKHSSQCFGSHIYIYIAMSRHIRIRMEFKFLFPQNGVCVHSIRLVANNISMNMNNEEIVCWGIF